MSNLAKAHAVASEWVESMGGLESIRHDHGSDLSGLMQALDDAGLLMPDVQIIRTVEELEALDPDTAVVSADNGEVYFAKRLTGLHAKPHFYVPAVVLMDGAQVRAARESMEEEDG